MNEYLDTPTPEAYGCAHGFCDNQAMRVRVTRWDGMNGPTVGFYGECGRHLGESANKS